MSSHFIFFHAFWHAGLIVKLVMLLLFVGSISSWTIIFYRETFFKRLYRTLNALDNLFDHQKNVALFHKIYLLFPQF